DRRTGDPSSIRRIFGRSNRHSPGRRWYGSLNDVAATRARRGSFASIAILAREISVILSNSASLSGHFPRPFRSDIGRAFAPSFRPLFFPISPQGNTNQVQQYEEDWRYIHTFCVV